MYVPGLPYKHWDNRLTAWCQRKRPWNSWRNQLVESHHEIKIVCMILGLCCIYTMGYNPFVIYVVPWYMITVLYFFTIDRQSGTPKRGLVMLCAVLSNFIAWAGVVAQCCMIWWETTLHRLSLAGRVQRWSPCTDGVMSMMTMNGNE